MKLALVPPPRGTDDGFERVQTCYKPLTLDGTRSSRSLLHLKIPSSRQKQRGHYQPISD